MEPSILSSVSMISSEGIPEHDQCLKHVRYGFIYDYGTCHHECMSVLEFRNNYLPVSDHQENIMAEVSLRRINS